jgi:hypothetical protein
VTEACGKHGFHLTVAIFRNREDVDLGETFANGIIALDPGDIDSMRDYMEGDPADLQWLQDHQYISILAHEIDHNRDTPNEGAHLDPTIVEMLAGRAGPAVDDENWVLSDLGVSIRRNNYGRWDPATGFSRIDYTVNGRIVTLRSSEHFRARAAAHRFAPPAVFTLGPSLVLFNPGEPCRPGGSPICYPLLADFDVDHDGVPDGVDNCIDLPNPRQSDHDGDGIGSACDHDDDEDGAGAALEAGTASADYDPTAMPEHWACAAAPAACAAPSNACADAIDNDRDGQTDLDDPACLVPDPSGFEFPIATPPGASVPAYHRLDQGGVPEKQDALLASATVRFDYDLDGSIDSVTTAEGVVVVRHDAPFLGGSGLTTMPGSVAGLSLHGFDPSLGEFLLHTARGSDNPFQLTAKQPGSDFPADGRIDYTISLNTTTFGALDEVIGGLQSSFVPWWQPFETIWNSFGPPMLFSLDDGSPVVRIVSITMRFERDTDFDGAYDPADNCPDDPNPGQEDGDTDGTGDVCDCGATDGSVWSRPPGLEIFFLDLDTLAFSPDGPPGSALDLIDIVRSASPEDFLTGTTCVGSNLPPWASGVTDTDTPAPRQVNYYLGQVENGCPGILGEGPGGNASDGTERQIQDCD